MCTIYLPSEKTASVVGDVPFGIMLEKHIRLYDITVSENIKVERVFHEDNVSFVDVLCF